jgi:hypothetical protein
MPSVVLVPAGLCAAVACLGYVAKHGHSRALSDAFVSAVVAALGLVFLVLEFASVLLAPVRLARRVAGLEAPRLDPALAAKRATGHGGDTSARRVVFFDGVCGKSLSRARAGLIGRVAPR